MSLLNQKVTLSRSNESRDMTLVIWQRLPGYLVCTIVGSVGGAVGVALTLGLAIIVQTILSPAVIFWPGVIPMAIAAVVLGLGVSGLLGLMAHRMFPTLADNTNGQGMHVISIFSAFTSLLQVFLFMQRL